MYERMFLPGIVWDALEPRRRPRPTWGVATRVMVVGLALVLALLGAVVVGDGVAYGGTVGGRRVVVVHSGDTLWSMATTYYDDSDPRPRVDAILAANHLRSSRLVPGQRLVLPPP